MRSHVEKNSLVEIVQSIDCLLAYCLDVIVHYSIACRYTIPHSAICSAQASVVVLAQSGLSSIIAAPGVPRYAAYAAHIYPRNLSAVPSARWIWDGPGNVNGCYMDITVE